VANPKSVRNCLLQAKWSFEAKNFKPAIKYCKLALSFDASFFQIIYPVMKNSYSELKNEGDLLVFLENMVSKTKSLNAVIAVADLLNQLESNDAALSYLKSTLDKCNELTGVEKFIALQVSSDENKDVENLMITKQLIRKLIDEKHPFHCAKCGFSSISLHWLCPGCRTWESMIATTWRNINE